MNDDIDLHEARLLEAGERLFFGEVPMKATRGLRGLIRPARVAKSQRTILRTAGAIRQTVNRVDRRCPEVMVKITGSTRNLRHLKAHLAYISRDGQIAVEDENFQPIEGLETLADVADVWTSDGILECETPAEVGEDGGAKSVVGRRESFNLVLSIPAGTDPLILTRAVRDFARLEFPNRQFVMALHTPDGDPGGKPAEQPHVHLTVKAFSHSGERLNPRKADLHRWRQLFAQALNDNGLEAVATRRQVRGERVPGRSHRGRYQDASGRARTRGGRRMSLDDAIKRNEATKERVTAAWKQVRDSIQAIDRAGRDQLPPKRQDGRLGRVLAEDDRVRPASDRTPPIDRDEPPER